MIENFRVMIIGWFYYGAVFMLGSIIVTAMLNKVFNKLYIPPLIINAVSIILLSVSFMNFCRFTSNCKKRAVQPTLRVQANPSLTVRI